MSASSDQVASTTNQTFLTALVLNSAIAAAEIIAFILLRRYFRKVYQPRSYLPSPDKRSEALASGVFAWIPQIWLADAEQIIHKNGLDAYCFLRFLRLILLIFTPMFILTWSLLLPIYSVHSGGGKSGLDQFTFGNIGTTTQSRLAAPLVVAYCFTFYVLYLLKNEIEQFIKKRQAFLTSDAYRASAQSRTVLLTGVPADLLTPEALMRFASHLPGGARRVWVARDLKDLPEFYDRREAAFAKLEGGYAKLISLVHKANAKSVKNPSSAPQSSEEGQEWSKYIPRPKRPSHKLGFLGLLGQKVDTIEWSTEELLETTKEIDSRRAQISDYKPHNSAFIEFNTQIAAHMFAQSLAHHEPMRLTGRWIDVASEDVIWSNLNMNPLEQRIRALISWAITISLIVFWALPVTFVGIISNVNSICTKVSFMAWLCKLPAPVPGLLQGVLPPVMLSVLFMLLPIVLRRLAIFQGIPLRSLVELSLMSRYFSFLVIHGFLVVTLSSGLMAAIPSIVQQPGSALTILANELPKASTFFLTYIVTTCFAGAAGSLLQLVGVIMYTLKLKFLASSPRSVYATRCGMSTVAWGTLFPNITLLAVIGLSYSVVSPILNGFVLVGFALFWFVYKYLFIYVMELSPASETGGKFFPKAIKQMFVGLYIGEIFIGALFFFSKDAQGQQSGVVEGALMVVLGILTLLFQILISKDFFLLAENLPVSLAGEGGLRDPDQTSEKSDGPIVEKDDRIRRAGSGMISSGGHEFDHPATWKGVATVWVAEDDLMIGEIGVKELRGAGVKASTEGARYDSVKKMVIVTRSPPDDGEEVFEIPPSD